MHGSKVTKTQKVALEAILFQIAGLLILEWGKSTNEVAIYQQHFADPTVQEQSCVFSIYLLRSPPLPIVIMFNCNKCIYLGLFGFMPFRE